MLLCRSFVNLFLPAYRHGFTAVKVNAVSPDHNPSIPLVSYVCRVAIFSDGNRGALPVARPSAYLPVRTVSDKQRIFFKVVMWILFHLVCPCSGDGVTMVTLFTPARIWDNTVFSHVRRVTLIITIVTVMCIVLCFIGL